MISRFTNLKNKVLGKQAKEDVLDSKVEDPIKEQASANGLDQDPEIEVRIVSPDGSEVQSPITVSDSEDEELTTEEVEDITSSIENSLKGKTEDGGCTPSDVEEEEEEEVFLQPTSQTQNGSKKTLASLKMRCTT